MKIYTEHFGVGGWAGVFLKDRHTPRFLYKIYLRQHLSVYFCLPVDLCLSIHPPLPPWPQESECLKVFPNAGVFRGIQRSTAGRVRAHRLPSVCRRRVLRNSRLAKQDPRRQLNARGREESIAAGV